jgi:hypothetical protein
MLRMETPKQCSRPASRLHSGAGTTNAIRAAMMIRRKKSIRRILEGVIAMMPAIPYLMKARRRTPIAAYVLGGVGIIIVGGVAALMFLSPRTRSKALNAAKDTYGRMNDRIGHLRSKAGTAPPMSDGLVDRGEYSTTATGA